MMASVEITEERAVEYLTSLLKKHVFESGFPRRPIPKQTYREIFIPLDFKPDQREQYKESLVKYYDFLKDEALHKYLFLGLG